MSKKLIVEAGALYKKAQGEPGEGPSFEQQFGILANAQITDKYPSLSNYQVAVQLLDKSDDNSFAVCAVVYKLGANFIYVPAVFSKGKISTAEIMEVPGLQMFLPLSDAWLSWIKNKDDKGEAEMIPAGDANMFGKPAGSARSREPIDPLLKNASKEPSKADTPSIFDMVLKMGKKASIKFMDYLSNPDFMNETFKFYCPQDIKKFAKAACEKYPEDPEIELITIMDKRAAQLTEEQQSVLWHDGYVIKKAQAVDWDESTNAIKVIEKKDLSTSFVTPDDSCKCAVLNADGTTDEVTLIKAKTLNNNNAHEINVGKYNTGTFNVSGQSSVQEYGNRESFFIKDGKAAPVEGIVTAVKDSIERLDMTSIGKPISSYGSQNNGYEYGDILLILPSGSVIDTKNSFHKEKDGSLYSYDLVIRESEDKRLREAITYDKVIEVPQGTRYVLTDYNEKQNVIIPDLGRTIERFLEKLGQKVKMTSDGQEISFYGPASKPSDRFMEKEAALHLVKDYHIAPKTAKAMLKMAALGNPQKAHSVTFILYKSAAADDFEESTDWKPADIGYTETTETPPTVTTEDLQNRAEQDARDIETITKATDAGVKEVFDTATLKLLMQDADPHEAIMDAVPDFMKTLDRLCQMLFLYRCHSQDMEEKYGSVKMKALEKSLQNTIKDLSQLTVFVKLRGMGNGMSPDAGDLQTGTMLQ